MGNYWHMANVQLVIRVHDVQYGDACPCQDGCTMYIRKRTFGEHIIVQFTQQHQREREYVHLMLQTRLTAIDDINIFSQTKENESRALL